MLTWPTLAGATTHPGSSEFDRIHRQVVSAIDDTLHMDASIIPYEMLDRKEFVKKARTDLAIGVEVNGPLLYDRVYFDLSSSGPHDPHVWAHEFIHYLARMFNRDAIKPPAHKMLEGITEYFAFQVIPGHPNPRHPYYGYLRFAEAIAAKIGGDKLRSIFFSNQAHQYSALRRAVVPNDPPRFDLACEVLVRGDYATAVAMLDRNDSVKPTGLLHFR